MSDWKHRAAVEIANEYAAIFETSDVPRAEMEAFVTDAIARHLPPLADEWPTIESVGKDQMFDMEKVTRVELIDGRNESKTFGHAFVAQDVSANVSIQDQGRTMKVFVTAPKSNDQWEGFKSYALRCCRQGVVDCHTLEIEDRQKDLRLLLRRAQAGSLA